MWDSAVAVWIWAEESRFLVAAVGAWRVVDPVEDDERQAADHEDDSHHQEDGRLPRGEQGYGVVEEDEKIRRFMWQKFVSDHEQKSHDEAEKGRLMHEIYVIDTLTFSQILRECCIY